MAVERAQCREQGVSEVGTAQLQAAFEVGGRILTHRALCRVEQEAAP